MQNKLVHIALSDTGWILERLAREVEARLPSVSFGTDEDKRAPIQYYVTYGRRRQRVSPVEVMLFTHQEQDPAAAARFMAAANDCEAAVAMSRATADILSNAGVAAELISPGVDLQRFRPRLKVAVVGRTYHTGRKGEALVNAVMDLPDIDWHFTGTGWPGAAAPVSDEDLPELYRSADYVLVPAVNEGGPMCVLEALACGTPVIGSDVGWVPDFPHIPFERGNAESLRAVLQKLLADKQRLASSVQDMSWDRWAAEHDRLFHRLARERGVQAAPVSIVPPEKRLQSVALLTHGIESSTLGGPTVRVPRTATALKALGVQAESLHFPSAQACSQQLLHGYNIWPPVSAVKLARRASDMAKPLVFSPILMDLGEMPLWRTAMSDAFRHAERMEDGLAAFARARAAFAAGAHDALALKEPEPGFLDALREIADRSSAFIFLSEHERRLAERLIPQVPALSHIVHNPVDAAAFGNADPALFRQTYGLTDYVLCVGRLETRKNQLLLAAALRELDLPLVLVGHVGDTAYADQLKRLAGPRLLHIDRLNPASPMLRSAMAGARVFTLPSWVEGAPLAALEAAAAGAKLVLSNRSSEREYFGDRARYCDPADVDSIRTQIASAWDQDRSEEERREQQAHVATQFSWERHAQATQTLYAEVIAAHRPVKAALRLVHPESGPTGAPASGAEPLHVVLDVTTMAQPKASRTGIVRVESALAQALPLTAGAEVRFVVWRSATLGYLEVPTHVMQAGGLKAFVADQETTRSATLTLPRGAQLVVVGSSWMQNGEYAESITEIADQHGLRLAVMMHDFTPVLFPYWYPEGFAPVFGSNMATLLCAAERVLVYSENTKADLTTVCQDLGLAVPPVAQVRLAEEIGSFEAAVQQPAAASVERWCEVPFVLAVGGIHARKNYGLLIDCWRELARSMGAACPRLLIVGGVAWNGGDQARAIREDRLLSRHVHILHDIDDAGLDTLYRHCLFSVYPSLYEGWGLPVAESLARGKICLASNQSSVPEVAPGLAVLLDPNDRRAWTTAIRHYAGSASARAVQETRIRERFVATRWQDTATALVQALRKPEAAPQRQAYSLGELVALTTAAGPCEYRRFGWHAREPWGSWTRDPMARLRVRLSVQPDEDLVLQAVVRVFARPGQTKRAQVFVNGERVANWSFPGVADPAAVRRDVLLSARIPRQCVPADGVLDIDIRSLDVEPIREVTPDSQDPRSLGVGMSAFTVQRVSRAVGLPSTLKQWWPLAEVLYGDDLLNSAVLPALPLNRWFSPGERAGILSEGRGAATPGPVRSDGRWVRLHGGLAGAQLGQDLMVEALIRGRAVRGQKMTVSLMVDHRLAGSWTLPDNGLHRLALRVDAAMLGWMDPVEIAFFTPEALLRAPGDEAEDLRDGCFEVQKLRICQAPWKAQPATLTVDEPLRLPIERVNALLAQGALDGGWHQPEEGGIWSLGNEGRLLLQAPAEPDAVALVDLGWVASTRADDAMEIHSAEQVSVCAAALPQPGYLCRVLPVSLPVSLPQAPAGKTVDVDLQLHRRHLAEPGSAACLGDPRILGARLQGVTMARVRALEPGVARTPRQLNLEGQAVLLGWHAVAAAPAEAMLWTRLPHGDLVLRLPPPQGTHRLRLTLEPAEEQLAAGADVTLLVNGHLALRTRFTEPGPHMLDLDLQAEWLGNSPVLMLTVAAPLLHRSDADESVVGVALRALELLAAPADAT